MSEWMLYIIGVSFFADGVYKRRSKNMKNTSKYYLSECSYHMSCKLLNKIGLYKLQSKTNNTPNNPFPKYGEKKVKAPHPLSSSPPTLSHSRFADVDCTIFLLHKFSAGGTCLRNVALLEQSAQITVASVKRIKVLS